VIDLDELTQEEIKDLDKIKESELTIGTAFDIKGLEDIPISMMPVPWVRLVQPTSQKVDMADGKDASVGSFYFSDTKTSVDKLDFIMLRAKIGSISFERDGKMQDVSKLAILGMILDNKKIFVLSLPVTSFGSFSVLIALMKEQNLEKTWEYVISLTSEKRENDRGKFYVAKFNLGQKVEPDLIAELEEKYHQYGSVLDRKDPNSESSESL